MNFKPKIEKSSKIDSSVVLGENNYIGHNTIIKGPVIIGDNNYIGHNVVIGEISQHSYDKYELNGFNFNAKDSKIVIGSNNVIREFSTVHQPMNDLTRIQDNCYLMAYNHIPHDADISNNVILSNNCQIGGHSHIHEYANIGLSSVLHQKTTIGAYSMIGMGSIVTKDIPPFLVAVGSPAKSVSKINEWGMKRYNFSEKDIDLINSFYWDANNDSNVLIQDTKIFKFFKNFYKSKRRNSIYIKDGFEAKISLIMEQ
tara:strand:- start:5495 stop:6262 length:768 start_codon:yes stop_codon:yes gene_type:complete